MQSNEPLVASTLTSQVYNPALPPSAEHEYQQQQPALVVEESIQEQEQEQREQQEAEGTPAASRAESGIQEQVFLPVSHDPTLMSQVCDQQERASMSGSGSMKDPSSWPQPSSDSSPAPSTQRLIEEKLRMLERERREVSQKTLDTASRSSSRNPNHNNIANEDDNSHCKGPESPLIPSMTTTPSSFSSVATINMAPAAIDTTPSSTPHHPAPLPTAQPPLTSTTTTSSTINTSSAIQQSPTITLASTENVAAAVLPYLSSFASSPSKMNYLESLVVSLQGIMDNQSVAMSDLRIQLQEIQDALIRVQNKREYMTKEERQVLQNAQMMKNLAEEVLSTQMVKDRPSSRASNNSPHEPTTATASIAMEKPTRISVASLAANRPITPPPTATTPPPSNLFDPLLEATPVSSVAMSSLRDRPHAFGHGLSQLSDASSTSSSRPSSMISRSGSTKRHRRNHSHSHNHRSSFRGFDAQYSHQSRKDYEQESNAAFERICGLLTLLITDASSAVGKASKEGDDESTSAIQPLLPLVMSDSESSSGGSVIEEEDETDDVSITNLGETVSTASAIISGDSMMTTVAAESDEQFAREMINGATGNLSDHVSYSSQPSSRAGRAGNHSRTRSRIGKDHPKRLSSLFVEIQDAQLALEAAEASAADGDGGQQSDQEEFGGDNASIASFSGRSSFLGNAIVPPPGNSSDDGMGGEDVMDNAEDLLDPAFASVDPPVYPTLGRVGRRRAATTTTRAARSPSMSVSTMPKSSTMPVIKRRSRTEHQQQDAINGSSDNDQSDNNLMDDTSILPPFRRSSSACSHHSNSIRRRASFPVPRRSEEWQQQQQLEQQLQAAELEQVIQRVDSELDRTVETIDGLTRDLVAVATHQNWMQAKLQKSLQFQMQQLERIEHGQYTRHSHQNHLHGLSGPEGDADDEEETDDMVLLLDPTGTNSPLQDLSRSLKRVAISVGKIMASNAATTSGRTLQGLQQRQRRRRTKTAKSSAAALSPHDAQESSSMDESLSPPKGTLPFSWPESFPGGKDLTKVLQRIERTTNLGGRLGMKFAEGMEALGRYSSSSSPSHSNAPSSSERPRGYQPDNSADEDEFEELDETAPSTVSSPFARQTHQHHSHDPAASSTKVLVPPPEFEDLMAQCRLLTRTLVLPFVQLTHHAMTSQDSALALQPLQHHMERTTATTATQATPDEDDSDRKQDKHRDKSQVSSGTPNKNTPIASPEETQGNPTSMYFKTNVGAMPTWPAAFPTFPSVDDDIDFSALSDGGGVSAIPADSMVKARTLVSTGLYLVHLLYWTVLFIVGTLVLDPFLAESSGLQVVRVVEQVRAAIGVENGASVAGQLEDGQQGQQQQQPQSILYQSSAPSSPTVSRRKRLTSSGKVATAAETAAAVIQETHEEREESVLQATIESRADKDTTNQTGDSNLSTSNMDLASLDLGLEWIELSQEQQAKAQAQVQALEDKAIQVAVHFESLRHRLQQSTGRTPGSSTSASRVNSRPSSIYFGTTMSTSSCLSTSSNNTTLVASVSSVDGSGSGSARNSSDALKLGKLTASGATFPSLVSLAPNHHEDDIKSAMLLAEPLSLSRSSSLKGRQQLGATKLETALPVSPLPLSNTAKPPLSSYARQHGEGRTEPTIPSHRSQSSSRIISSRTISWVGPKKRTDKTVVSPSSSSISMSSTHDDCDNDADASDVLSPASTASSISTSPVAIGGGTR